MDSAQTDSAAGRTSNNTLVICCETKGRIEAEVGGSALGMQMSRHVRVMSVIPLKADIYQRLSFSSTMKLMSLG